MKTLSATRSSEQLSPRHRTMFSPEYQAIREMEDEGDAPKSSISCRWKGITSMVLGACLLFFAARLLMPQPSLPADSVVFFRKSNICKRPDYTSTTLKTDYEQSFFALLSDTKGEQKFEASDVVVFGDSVYIVCDNSWSVAKFHKSLVPFSEKNKLLGNPVIPGMKDSSWEAIVFDPTSGHFFVTREAIPHEGHYHAHITELKIDKNDYQQIETCKSEFVFKSENKGFEGMVLLPSKDGEVYLLGLCEGNYCEGGKRGRNRGHGRMVMMKKTKKHDQCLWETLRVLKLPAEISFMDYSSASLYGNALAVTSQEDSQVWIGMMTVPASGVVEDPDKLQVLSGGRIFNFPRDDNCDVVYCNIEGISFINDRMLVAVSDQMKSGGKQDFRCLQKDQSVHVFSLPAGAVTQADVQDHRALA
eukprot:GHVQ01033039.1.p1 GENE.GHVQ01033039.1~~GHVQ01033039.1.p1  ORF type:complete len:417 (-),score=31.93 GHVQ01033039.1:343-1593(-)